MLSFFRRLRKQLLTENRFSKYLLYAIGEIVLVVIGILIALQINEWNEARKNREFEREILEQIQANLVKDQENLTEIAHNFKRAVASSDKLLNGNWDEAQADSLKFWLGDIVQFDRFQPLTNAYEVIKSKGLDLISNKKLRIDLGTYYDDQAQHAKKSIADLEVTFNSDWNPVMLEQARDFKYKSYVVVKDFQIFLQDTKARRILIMNRDNYGSGLERIQSILATIDNIQAQIRQELQGIGN
ncbi:DUF6090 family protein [Robiginitalea sp. M366]|uniref:DUF6090 family protein n=1 Tax=Robiginitalea aestuariiviva TaxID=3036903 RepID=UPI00240DEB33|nr:DUF6090 family protein [Robiginitalea aestuariiviva]MDG1571144.1 DUF6090 family protein [Robiginitalea aestuariiviva]